MKIKLFPARNEKFIRVMSFNIRHGEGLSGKVSLEAILEVLKEGDADIIGLQEVDRHLARSGNVDQAAKLASGMGMQWCFSPSLQKGSGEYGNAILSKYPIASERTYFLPGAKERRSVLQADVRIGRKKLVVLNTHLGVTKADREEQVPLLLKIVQSVRCPAVLLGDFNMEADDLLMGTICTEWHKITLRIKAPTLINGQEIDHIITNAAVNGAAATGLEAWTLQTQASDHHAVIANIPLNMIQLE